MARTALPSLLAVSVAALGAGGAGGAVVPARALAPPAADEAPGAPGEAVCPPAMLPDGDICVHLPRDDDDAPDAPVAANAHRERSGRWAAYEQIPRRPDRPADYDAYRYPIPPGLPGGHSVVSGYDLDRPDTTQRRGHGLRAVGHGGVDLPQRRGTKVTIVALEHQQGDADVLYTGPYFGTTVMTRHVVREAGQLRDYIVLFGHLDRVAPGLAPGAHVKEGDVIGFVGDTASPELVHLHLEARRVRDGVDATKKSPAELLEPHVSVVCDPRNVLPLRDE